MQWFKERTSFIIGSDRWMGGQGSSSSSQSSTPSEMPSPAPPNGATQYNPLSGIRVRSPTRDELLDKASPLHSKLYPDIYKGDESSQGNKVQASSEVQASEEVLVRIPGAMAHLIDDEESVLLASGEFCLVKLSQNGTDVAMFARVGDDLQWPLVKDEPATKLDPSHYVFSLRVDPDDDEEKSSKEQPETLSYGVTFKVDDNKELLQELDKLLQHYSYFSAPQVLQASDEDLKTRDISADELAVKGKPVSTDVVAEQKPSAENSVAFWTTIAPNVNDYNSSLARGIASGTGQLIRGIFWCSDTTVSQLQKGGQLVKRNSGVCSKPSEVSPTTMRNLRRVKRVTKMSEKVAKGVLTGVVTVTGFFTTSVVNSKAGKKFFKLLPGEVALASLEAFGKIFDAVEVAGTNVLNTTSVVTTGAISNRYGDQAGEAAHESFATAGHLFSTAWAISKLRNAFNPKNAIKPSAVLRQAAKAAGKKT